MSYYINPNICSLQRSRVGKKHQRAEGLLFLRHLLPVCRPFTIYFYHPLRCRWLAWMHNEEEEEEEVPLLRHLTPATQVKSRRQRDETKIMKKTLIKRVEKIVGKTRSLIDWIIIKQNYPQKLHQNRSVFCIELMPRSHQSLNMFENCLVKHGLKLFSL